ncbi:unnamed protein product [Pedinophyceae sp. YPF-701]|nr:unnamed protein product [Pedinophyceae sp. YPF-701]
MAQGELSAALELFEEVMSAPTPEKDLQTALYSAARCYASLDRVEDGVRAIQQAVSLHGLAPEAAGSDPDLVPLRANSAFVDLVADTEPAGPGDAQSPETTPGLPATALTTGLVSSGLSALYLTSRVMAAGASSASLAQLQQQLAVALGAAAVFGALLFREKQGLGRGKSATLSAQESLGGLLVAGDGGGAAVAGLAGRRTVVLLGPEKDVLVAAADAQGYRGALLGAGRGCAVLPLITDEQGVVKNAREVAGADGTVPPGEWELSPVDGAAWARFAREGVPGDALRHMIIGPDGAVESVGDGAPVWAAMVRRLGTKPVFSSVTDRLLSSMDGEGEDTEGARSGTAGQLLSVAALGIILLLVGAAVTNKDALNDALAYFTSVVDDWGYLGMAAYVAVYAVLEILAVPAIPLTMTAGALFGTIPGTIVSSLGATIAATGAFLIARYLARDRVLAFAQKNAKFRAIDRAIGKDSFKIVALLRLSPLLPFSLGNYLYGLTSVQLAPYVAASWLGMLPGTYAYVVAGKFGRDALAGGAEGAGLEWWKLALGAAVTLGTVVYIGNLANEAMKEEGLADGEAGEDAD